MTRKVLPQIAVTMTNASQGLGNVRVGLSIGCPYRQSLELNPFGTQSNGVVAAM